MDRETATCCWTPPIASSRNGAVGKSSNNVAKGVWPTDLGEAIEEMGLLQIAVLEEKGGAGGSLADMLALLRLAGSHAVPVPLAETAPPIC